MPKVILLLLGLIAVGGGVAYLWLVGNPAAEYEAPVVVEDTAPVIDSTIGPADDEEEPEEEEEEAYATESRIGKSVAGNDLGAYHFGTGEKEVLFIGGTHGGYSWNTSLLAYEMIDWLGADEDRVPDDVRVTVIPVLNPDGLAVTTGSTGEFAASDADESKRVAGRFNSNDVDLNRNFDCEWEAEGTWQSQTVSGGNAPFSEPEAAALKDYVDEHDPAAVVVYYTSAGGVYASACGSGILPDTRSLTNAYADATGYDAFDDFDSYEVTGDMVNWLASERIPAISVLLTTHTDAEWGKNQSGVQAVLKYVAQNE